MNIHYENLIKQYVKHIWNISSTKIFWNEKRSLKKVVQKVIKEPEIELDNQVLGENNPADRRGIQPLR